MTQEKKRPTRRPPSPRKRAKAAHPHPHAPAPALEVSVEPPAPPPSQEDVADRIRELEERLDKMIDEAAKNRAPMPYARRAGAAQVDGDDEMAPPPSRPPAGPPLHEIDEFGFDPAYEEKVLPFFNFLYSRYFRVETDGAEKIPDDGRCLLVANHAGTYDGMMLKLAVKHRHPKKRDVRWLAEDFVFHFPFIGAFSNRVGAVRACQENAERLLENDALVAVFPEGTKGTGKLFKDRYKLQRFGRGGFVKLALRTETPIVPVAIVGAEEAHPMLFRIEYLTKALGLPFIPVTPAMPLPSKWKILFGDPIRFTEHGPEAADDELLVGRLSERVRATIQGMLDRALGERRSIWFG